jgi:2-polyprenyl-3-methyl-5-hydroxy-6-metoxy-1,4-benzoquinol methylase
MLLSLTTTHRPATNLGYLLRKNPVRAQSFNLTFGIARVFYPEATEERCTAALLVEVDPVGLVRNRRGPSGEGGLLDQYVNDRPYAASSFLSVAIANVFDAALGGRCKEKPELAETPLPLQARLSAVPCRGGEEFLRNLFEPLGYTVTAQRLPLDTRFPEWGESPYHHVELRATLPLHQLLSHLYVLLPVLDNDKHYWVGDDEVEKLLRHGEGWLAAHPERAIITRRYLKHRRSLVDDAIERLAGEADPHLDDTAKARSDEEEALESQVSNTLSPSDGERAGPVGQASSLSPSTDEARQRFAISPNDPAASSAAEPEGRQDARPTLHEIRLATVVAALRASGATSVLDLGCGEGKLVRLLLKEKQFARIVGMDVSHRGLEIAADRLHYDRLPPKQKERLQLLHGSLMYRDARLAGFDAAAVVEVVEHLDPPRLAAFERVLFEFARPGTVVLTTPNREYNVMWPSFPAGRFRHRDHRFEWTRAEFQAWAHPVAVRYGYTVTFAPIGPEDESVGAPTQMATFQRDAR